MGGRGISLVLHDIMPNPRSELDGPLYKLQAKNEKIRTQKHWGESYGTLTGSRGEK
jgi:hypothetical protein